MTARGHAEGARWSAPTRWTILALVAVLTVVAACSGDDSSDDDTEEAVAENDSESAGPEPGEDVARPTVSGPITGGERDQPFTSMPAELADEYGYVEEEFFLEGDATTYEADGELTEDGRWTVTEAGTAEYRTRIIVRRPADADDFDGTVFVEWLNVSGGVDADPDFSMFHPELLGHGSVYVGVSAQQAGVEGGGGALPIEGVEIQALKQWDPERYGELIHPGDQYSYDIYSQVAQAVRRPDDVDDVDVLDGLEATHVIAVGESQSAARMVTYVDAVHPVAEIFDGFLVHSRGGGGAPLDDSPSILGEGTARIRDDLDVPVFQLLTETDLFGVLGFARARQDDTDLLRTWEVAGTAHADRSILDYNADMAAEAGAGFDIAGMCGSINEGPQAQVLRAALAALRTWVVDGEAPPEAPPLEVEGEAIVRDERGIALGGIRTPAVDAPVSVLTGEAPEGGSVLCMLFGETRPFDAATLAELYPSHDDYVDAVTEAAESAVESGFLLQDDADAFVAAAEEASVP